MSCSNNSANRRDIVRSLSEIVLDAVTHFRNRGHRSDHAIQQAALALELSPRRVKSLVYGEAYSVAVDEYERVRRAFLRHLDEQAEDLMRRSEQARARRRQMELRL